MSSGKFVSSVYKEVLASLASTNTILTAFMFVWLVGVSIQNTQPDPDNLVFLEAFAAFGCFTCSMFMARGLEILILIGSSKADINIRVLRFGLAGVIIVFSLGFVFSVLSIINMMEIRFGVLAFKATIALIVLAPLSLVMYIAPIVLCIYALS